MPRRKPQIQTEKSIERVGVYARVSTEEQAKDGYGLDAQRTRCSAMASVKGWAEPQFYVDEGISGTKDSSKRPQLARLLADVRSGKLDAVIVLSLDRLGRKTRLVLDLVDELTRYGVTLVSCKESLDTATPQGQFVLTLFAALAQLERDLISERTTAALAERGAIDGEKGGRLPYGYIRTATGISIEPIAAEVIRQIYRLRYQGKSLRAIAAEVQQLAPSPRGGNWHASSVSEILLNEAAYRGGSRGSSSVRWQVILDSID